MFHLLQENLLLHEALDRCVIQLKGEGSGNETNFKTRIRRNGNFCNTPPRNVSVYSAMLRSGKNVKVLLPHACRGRRGSEIYLHTRVELSITIKLTAYFSPRKPR